ncbi:MAG: glycine dehydrogenase, partial [candidate division Zixibacteria bacterium]|nr:glycine dehydrogenase [candidate division Zixibacteria bacterium]
RFEPYFKGDYIREVAIKTPIPAKEIINKLINKNNILAGIDVGRFYDEMDDCILLSVTEKRTEDEIESLIKALKEI